MKTPKLSVLLALVCCTQLHAQDTTHCVSKADTAEFRTVIVQASFPGGEEAWRHFLVSHLRTNVPVKNKAPAGVYKVEISFLVSEDGSVSNLQVEKDPGFGTAEEVLRVFKKCPKWNPVWQNGRPVIYRQRQSIAFLVEEEGPGRKRG